MPREIGPIGTTSRVVAGVLAIALPIAFEGISWWDAPALLATALIATAAASLAPQALTNHGTVCSPAGCILIAVLYADTYAIGAATPAHGDIALWGFIGLSMLLAAVRGDGGCEVLALPNAITGRRDRIGCILFTPIDTAEARRRRAAPLQPQGRPAATGPTRLWSDRRW